ncbi:MAG TPA: alpha/beta fold hydrolase [Symbiobacteriaceae bacterium]|nr:alpha/beta fold hydrolase [Symbiobacteriaceae bacterium]
MQPVISIEPITLAKHKVLNLFPRGLTGPAPTIILYHGWFGSKEAQVPAAQLLACHGFRVLLPDLPGHGERTPLVADRPEAAYDHFWAMIMQSIDEVEAIVGDAVDRGLARRSSIGIAGSSAGGMVAVSALGRYPWLRAAVGHNTCPSFEWLDSISTNAPPLQGADLDRLRTYDPVNLAGEMSPRPLLLMHGTADTILPAEGARRFVEQARAGAYAPHPDRLIFTELPRLDHWVTIGMVATMQQWFERWISQ